MGRSKPSIVHRFFNMADSGTTAYSNAKFDPTVMLQGHKPLYLNEDAAEYNVTNLNNGFTVLTESTTFPGAVNMGKCLCDQLSAACSPAGECGRLAARCYY